MKIAVTHDNGTVYQHFGHTKQFKIYTVEDNKVVSSETVDTGDSGHGALAGFLAARDVSIVICGNMGAGAQNALTEAGIQFFGGVAGNTGYIKITSSHAQMPFSDSSGHITTLSHHLW